MEKLFTIGVYGTDEKLFFETLTKTKIDLFCDIRQRRGVRGRTYAYVNSSYLQTRLETLGIGYLYYKQLAPTTHIRELQATTDKKAGIVKHEREALGQTFIKAYNEEIISKFDEQDFLKHIGDYKRICLFCVECSPTACHRYIAVVKLSEIFMTSVEHLIPCQQKKF
jgi:hypothetical protein